MDFKQNHIHQSLENYLIPEILAVHFAEKIKEKLILIVMGNHFHLKSVGNMKLKLKLLFKTFVIPVSQLMILLVSEKEELTVLKPNLDNIRMVWQ